MSESKAPLANIQIPPVAFPKTDYLYLKLPLYTDITLDESQESPVRDFIRSQHRLECFCVGCQEKSIFHNEGQSSGSGAGMGMPPPFILLDKDFFHTFFCARNKKHLIQFWFRIKDRKLSKAGQYPSQADIATGEISKYRKLLGDDAKEFSKAIGLAAHGVGIGAFVYLRRIIEHLVEETHIEATKDRSWKEKKYVKARFNEKIKMLAKLLPEFLSKNPILYGILSKGIHELDEQECLEAFPILKIAIELILDEKLRVKEREEKIKDAQIKLSKLKEKHSG